MDGCFRKENFWSSDLRYFERDSQVYGERNVILENVKFVFRNFIIEGNVFQYIYC